MDAVTTRKTRGRSKSLTTCMAVAQLRKVSRNRRGEGRLWSFRDIAELRHTEDAYLAKCLSESIRQRSTEAAPAGAQGRTSLYRSGDILKCFLKEDIKRGELGLELERQIERLCKGKETGPKPDLGLLDLEDQPLDRLQEVVADLKAGEDTVTTQRFRQQAGPELLAMWRRKFGRANQAPYRYIKREPSAAKRYRRRKPLAAKTPAAAAPSRPPAAPCLATPPTIPIISAPVVAEPPIAAPRRPPSRKRAPLALKRIALAASFLVFLGATGVAGVALYKENTFAIARTHGYKKALEHIRAKFQSDQANIELKYDLAFYEYYNGMYSEAEDKVNSILSQTQDRAMIAECYYLLAAIRSLQGRDDEALGFYDMSKRHYPKQKTYPRYLIALEKARIHLRHDQLTEVNLLLDEALAYYEASNWTKVDLDHYWFLKSYAALYGGDFQTAISASAKRLDLFEAKGDLVGQADANSDLGLMYLAAGDQKLGFAHTQKADDFRRDLDDETGLIYNKVNWILFNRCQGLDYSRMEAEVRDLIAKGNAPDLVRQLEVALETDCQQPLW